MAVRKKKVVVPRRPKTGLGAVPLDHKRGFEAIKYYFHYELDTKSCASCIKDYVKREYTEEQAKAILLCPEYKFTIMSHHAATAFLLTKDYDFGEKYSVYPPALKKYCDELLVMGQTLLEEKKQEATATSNIVVLSPQQRLARKVNNTIMRDLDELEDKWITGDKASMDIIPAMQKYELKGAAVPLIRPTLEGLLLDYKDAYEKNCEQAVEGYSHLTRREIKRRATELEKMLSDLDSFTSMQKAKRTVRAKKPKAADKQVARVKYKKEDGDYKIASINPTQIVGANQLYVFNTKYRQLMVYVTTATKGFEVSGTSIKNFEPDLCTKITIRANKVDEVLKAVLNKTPKQIDKFLDTINSKPSVPNGRLNEETILLRAI